MHYQISVRSTMTPIYNKHKYDICVENLFFLIFEAECAEEAEVN